MKKKQGSCYFSLKTSLTRSFLSFIHTYVHELSECFFGSKNIGWKCVCNPKNNRKRWYQKLFNLKSASEKIESKINEKNFIGRSITWWVFWRLLSKCWLDKTRFSLFFAKFCWLETLWPSCLFSRFLNMFFFFKLLTLLFFFCCHKICMGTRFNHFADFEPDFFVKYQFFAHSLIAVLFFLSNFSMLLIRSWFSVSIRYSNVLFVIIGPNPVIVIHLCYVFSKGSKITLWVIADHRPSTIGSSVAIPASVSRVARFTIFAVVSLVCFNDHFSFSLAVCFFYPEELNLSSVAPFPFGSAATRVPPARPRCSS